MTTTSQTSPIDGRVGFIGLGNVGAKLAGSLLRNGADLVVLDLDPAAMQPFVDGGAAAAESPAALAAASNAIVSTAWKPPSVSVTSKSTIGNSSSGPLFLSISKPSFTLGMYSLGTLPPTILDSNTKPVPGSPGLIV